MFTKVRMVKFIIIAHFGYLCQSNLTIMTLIRARISWFCIYLTILTFVNLIQSGTKIALLK